MDKEYFKKILNTFNIELNEEKLNKFEIYLNELIETNKNFNLTRIVDEKDVLEKHFLDSLIINKYINSNDKVIDIGSGAGFPGIPLKIFLDNINILMVDSVNKKVDFINKIISELKLENALAIHERAEDLAHNIDYREKYDVAVSRAVANMSTLAEYLIPFVKIDGKIIYIKGPNIKDELNNSKNAINILGGKIEYIYEYKLPNLEQIYNIIVIKKVKSTNSKYPRKAGIPNNNPIK
ncbi:MAG: 16S rRNA (guanine(527)-N(7))-methyltransferase RsmG [Clostridia bacterium]|nr:16S rRNA (guanine(527)-N(7))-methyltransferase RsmG [Clostridia bacterium]